MMKLPDIGKKTILVSGKENPTGLTVWVDHEGMIYARAANGAIATRHQGKDGRTIRTYSVPRPMLGAEQSAFDAALDKGFARMMTTE